MSIRPFLMFQGGVAEAALNLYVSVFDDAEIVGLMKGDGRVLKATLKLGDQEIMCNDSPVEHAFTFTPSTSFFVECSSEQDLRTKASQLGAGGRELMPIDDYGFSQLFTWLDDVYGVSWQLNLA